MKSTLRLWLRIAIVLLSLCLAVGAAVFPLVFSETVLSGFLRILELVARLS